MHGVSIMFSNKSIVESEFQLVSMLLCFPSVLCHGVLVLAWITISDESDIEIEFQWVSMSGVSPRQ